MQTLLQTQRGVQIEKLEVMRQVFACVLVDEITFVQNAQQGVYDRITLPNKVRLVRVKICKRFLIYDRKNAV
jgi:hypothetical protein